ncbi:hypothetical protein [Geomonas sp.]|uniref:FecR family protein n=1 Tax=Geomonas sp. TaxID=2651584 RepID=UPI002B46FDD7|nr:hypothetical protein [Geomonas sp.]HJV36189.1 hypothetical protein [Geomonas sp.]
MIRILLVILYVLLTVAPVGAAQEQHQIGLIKTVSGEAYVLRGGTRLAAHPGMQLVTGDRLATGSAGSMGVVLVDDTVLSLGPATETSVEQFVYEPTEKKFGMVMKVARGLIAYLSGKISKLAPGSVRIDTPVAPLGVRGTYLLIRVTP